MVIYKKKSSSIAKSVNSDIDLGECKFKTICDEDELRTVFKCSGIEPDKQYYGRIKDKDEFVCIVTNENQLVSYGWITNRTLMPISEIRLQFISKNTDIILYDFYTVDKYRRQGFYSKLLNLIMLTKKADNFVIYALVSNLASTKAILKSGFKKLSNIYLIFSHQLRFFK